jgi:hypothetical protein
MKEDSKPKVKEGLSEEDKIDAEVSHAPVKKSPVKKVIKQEESEASEK